MTRRVFTVDFRREAVRLTQTSGRTIKDHRYQDVSH
jgi:transposase-like protein